MLEGSVIRDHNTGKEVARGTPTEEARARDTPRGVKQIVSGQKEL